MTLVYFKDSCSLSLDRVSYDASISGTTFKSNQSILPYKVQSAIQSVVTTYFVEIEFRLIMDCCFCINIYLFSIRLRLGLLKSR